MSNNRGIFYLFFFLFIFNRAGWAQPEVKHFSNISVDKGLSQSTVFAITQDHLGFMWLGTQDGLNRYDGNSFTVYRPLKNQPSSISSYYIFCLLTDKKGTLWVGGNGGISSYDPAADAFKNYNITPQPGEWYISCIIQDATGTIWASTNAGEIFRLDNQKATFERFNFNLNAYGAKEIYSIGFAGKRLLVGTENGLLLLNLQTAKAATLKATKGRLWVNNIFSDGPNLWIGTEGEGLLKMDVNTLQFIQYRYMPSDVNSLADNNVRSINRDTQGNLWIGTFRGLSIMNDDGRFQNFYHQPTSFFSLSQNSVRSIYRDKQGGMWLGTYYGGVSYYHNQHISFNLLSQNTGTPALNDKVVNVIRQDAKGNIWIGTNDRGVNYWDQATNTIKYYTYNNAGGSISSNNIKAIAFGSDGKVFLGTHDAGLNVFNPATGQSKVYRHQPGNPLSIPGNMVYALLKDHNNIIWVGTRTGLSRFNLEDESFETVSTDKSGKHLSSDEITFLMEDTRRRIWIGTLKGVALFYPEQNTFETVYNETLSSDVVNFVEEDKNGRIWVGTRNGLNLFDEKTKKFISAVRGTDFLTGNINSIVADDNGALWIAQNAKLIKYNPDTNSSQYFDSRDGIQNGQFNIYAACKAMDGTLYFGGTNGIVFFNPKISKQAPLQLAVMFTGLKLFNQTVTTDNSEVLDRGINDITALKFTHEQKQFTLFFNTFDYISANRIKYLYKLDGFDKNWVQTTSNPSASYTNLQPGSYTFHVKAIGPEGEESPERLLSITVKPIWYKSNWFLVLIAVLAVTGTIFLYRILTERMRALHQLRLERVNREKANYINKVKMDFFTNVSHELRTPLTLIMAPLEELLTQPVTDKKLHRSLELMMRNTKRLYNIVNQLFEFKKTEMGTRQLRVGKRDLVHLMKDIYKSFIPLSEKKNINYEYETPLNELYFLFDKEAVEHIVFNLLSNAFKYTSDGRTITIRLDASTTHAVITVSDTGDGIDAEHIDKIFDRFYQVDGTETNLGSGVGLAFTRRLVELHHGSIEVKSQPRKGSSFVIQLPLQDGEYEKDLRLDAVNIEKEPEGKGYDPASLLPVEELEDATFVTEDEYDNLLIVDDNREIVSYLKEYFSKSYHVVTAYNGKEALKAIEHAPPDAIVSDIMMPEMDGLHFCKRVKQNIQTSHIPVLLLTAKSETAQQLKGLEMGADDYISKPFSISVLEARLQTLLRSRKKLREFYASGKEVEPEKLTFNNLDQEFLEKAIAIIEANLDEYDFSVEKLSRELGMSRSNLYMKLKAITGESVTALIKRIRLKKATDLLNQRKYTIAEIAYMCGFNTPSYFSTAFKQFYGYIPTEYLDGINKE